MDYWEYRLEIPAEYRDIVLAFLAELPFDMFEELPEGLAAFLPLAADDGSIDDQLYRLAEQYSFSFERRRLAGKNWNEEWEAAFSPIRVGNFCGVRADFHSPITDTRFEIIINPKMAFGTGHHETTYLMIQLMESLAWNGAKVLDYGSGTGILAILAAKLGATMVDAVDIEAAAYDNAIENAQINGVDSIHVIQGTLDAVLDTGYDVILANINRNVILDSLPSLYEKLKPGGVLLISGLLVRDADLLREASLRQRFTIDGQWSKGEWVAMKLLR